MKARVKYVKDVLYLEIANRDNAIRCTLEESGWITTNGKEFWIQVTDKKTNISLDATLSNFSNEFDLNLSSKVKSVLDAFVETGFTVDYTDLLTRQHIVITPEPTEPTEPTDPTEPIDVDLSEVVKLRSETIQKINGGLNIDKVERWDPSLSHLGLADGYKPSIEIFEDGGWMLDSPINEISDTGVDGVELNLDVVVVPDSVANPDELDDTDIRKVYLSICRVYQWGNSTSVEFTDSSIETKLARLYDSTYSSTTNRPRFWIITGDIDKTPATYEEAKHFTAVGKATKLQRHGKIELLGRVNGDYNKGDTSLGISIPSRCRVIGLQFYINNGDDTAYTITSCYPTALKCMPPLAQKVVATTQVFINMPVDTADDFKRYGENAYPALTPFPTKFKRNWHGNMGADLAKGVKSIVTSNVKGDVEVGDIVRIIRKDNVDLGYDDYRITEVPNAGTSFGIDEELRYDVKEDDGVVFYNGEMFDFDTMPISKPIPKGVLVQEIAKLATRDSEIEEMAQNISDKVNNKCIKVDSEATLLSTLLIPPSGYTNRGFKAVPAPIYHEAGLTGKITFPLLNANRLFYAEMDDSGVALANQNAFKCRMSNSTGTSPTSNAVFYLFSHGNVTFVFSSQPDRVVGLSAVDAAELLPLLNANGLIWVEVVGAEQDDEWALMSRKAIENLIDSKLSAP